MTRRAPLIFAVAGCLLAAGIVGAAWLASAGCLGSRLGAPNGLPTRFLRLASAAVLTLPAIVWLYAGLAAGPDAERRVVRWGRLALVGGAIGMPIVLSASALVSVRLKVLLPLPADAVFAGTVVGAWLAGRRAHFLEAWGWRLVAISMGIGLLLGAFAFEGPLPPPHLLREYEEFPRRMVRGLHVGTILLGMGGIAAGRGIRCSARRRATEREG